MRRAETEVRVVTAILNLWHPVPIDDLSFEISNWCETEFGRVACDFVPDYHLMRGVSFYHNVNFVRFDVSAVWDYAEGEDGRTYPMFKNLNDAIHFKLRWG